MHLAGPGGAANGEVRVGWGDPRQIKTPLLGSFHTFEKVTQPGHSWAPPLQSTQRVAFSQFPVEDLMVSFLRRWEGRWSLSGSFLIINYPMKPPRLCLCCE